MTKRLISILLVLTLAVLPMNVITSHAEAAGAQFKVTSSAGQVRVNDDINLTVWFDTVGSNVYGAEVTLKYDPALVTRVNKEDSEEIGSGFGSTFYIIKEDPAKGLVTYAGASKIEKSGNLELIKLTFKAKKSGSASFTLQGASAVIRSEGNLTEIAGFDVVGTSVNIYTPSGGGGGGSSNTGGEITLPPVTQPGGTYYSDIFDGFWAADAINELSAAGVIAGFPDGTFRPNHSATRAAVITMLIKGLKFSSDTPSDKRTFADVREGHWAYQNIEIAARLGIAAGSKGVFRPDTEITREELVVLIVNCLKVSGYISSIESGVSTDDPILARFTDADSIPEWARGAVKKAVELGVVQGVGNGSFGSGQKATRAQVAVLIHKVLQLREAQ